MDLYSSPRSTTCGRNAAGIQCLCNSTRGRDARTYDFGNHWCDIFGEAIGNLTSKRRRLANQSTRRLISRRAGAAQAPAERVTYIGVPANSVYLTVAAPVI
jgi:hypothetical protein